MATKKSAPLDETTVEVTENIGNFPGIDLVRRSAANLPLASQINTLLDEVERLSKIK